MRKPSKFQFDPDDFVHVVQNLGETISGMYNGETFTFEHGVPSEPVHWKVAHHIFGYMGTEQARLNAVLRRGWATHVDTEVALRLLKSQVQFQPMNPFPKGVIEFRRQAEQDEAQPDTPTVEASPVGPAAPERPAASPAPPDPYAEARGSRAKKSG